MVWISGHKSGRNRDREKMKRSQLNGDHFGALWPTTTGVYFGKLMYILVLLYETPHLVLLLLVFGSRHIIVYGYFS